MARKPRLVGLNHIALEVGDVEAALRFYGKIFAFRLRGKLTDDDGRTTMAFIDLCDQFIALSEGRTQTPDENRHFGLVVEDRSDVRALAQAAGAKILDADFNFVDPWGNRLEIVAYRDVQFSKTEEVLKALDVSPQKSADALEQLREKGLRS